MTLTSPALEDYPARRVAGASEAIGASASGVSWGAIIAGAAVAIALTLILLLLGFGLGFSVVSPWSTDTSAAAVGLSSVVWITLTQIVAFAVGGYMAGRLRVKWVNVPTHEVRFRDTAHGFLTWALGTLLMATILGSAVSAIVGGGVRAVSAAAGAATALTTAAAARLPGAGGLDSDQVGYLVDSLFRTDQQAAPDPNDRAARVEVAKILLNDLRSGSLSAEDKRYIGQIVSKRTGLSPADAEQRVEAKFADLSRAINEAENTAKQAAEKARKAAGYSSLWTFVTLLCGAIFASLGASFGGKRRDRNE